MSKYLYIFVLITENSSLQSWQHNQNNILFGNHWSSLLIYILIFFSTPVVKIYTMRLIVRYTLEKSVIRDCHPTEFDRTFNLTSLHLFDAFACIKIHFKQSKPSKYINLRYLLYKMAFHFSLFILSYSTQSASYSLISFMSYDWNWLLSILASATTVIVDIFRFTHSNKATRQRRPQSTYPNTIFFKNRQKYIELLITIRQSTI